MTTSTIDPLPMTGESGKPGRNCPRCPRLIAFRDALAPPRACLVQCAGPLLRPLTARLLIVGLAPGLQGANRTGRPFTGDYAGDLLYDTLARYGFARGKYEAHPEDGLELVDARITNAVRCVPPAEQADRQPRSRPAAFSSGHHCRNAQAARGRGARAASRMTACWRRSTNAPRPPTFGHGASHDDRRAASVLQLSLLALQHQHRRADAGNVP